MQIKSTGTYFLASQERVKPLGHSPGLRREQCNNATIAEGGGFAPEDAKIACRVFSDGNFNSFLKNTVDQQLVVLVTFALMQAWFGRMSLKWLGQGVEARAMFRRLQKRAQTHGQ